MPARAQFSVVLILVSSLTAPAQEVPWVTVSRDKNSFVLHPGGKTFIPWGVNYDHDSEGRLIEDYWDREWAAVEQDFKEMKELGANVVRIHLQLGKFMETPDRPSEKSLDRLTRLLDLAGRTNLYLDITGLGCYHKKDVPPWYDPLSEQDRWGVQARFWEAIAARCAGSPAVFCYDLMNEPVVPAGRRNDGEWLVGELGGKFFVQFISLDQKDRPRPDIARRWIQHLSGAIRKHDKRHLITVGLLPNSLDRKGITSGFVPEKIVADLDFISVHLYPQSGKVDDALTTLAGFSVGKPVVVEEMFCLRCSVPELDQFVDGSRKYATGWMGFYWGKTPEQLRQSRELKDAVTLAWLEYFQKKGKAMRE
jgi:hypothetical protein